MNDQNVRACEILINMHVMHGNIHYDNWFPLIGNLLVCMYYIDKYAIIYITYIVLKSITADKSMDSLDK